MRLAIENFFKQQTALLEAGDFEALAKLFKPPLPVFYSRALKLNANRAHILHAMKTLCDGLEEIGVTRVTHRILDVTQRPGTATFSTLVEFEYRNKQELLRTSRIRYFLEREPKGFRIAMVEYFSMAFKGVLDEPPS